MEPIDNHNKDAEIEPQLLDSLQKQKAVLQKEEPLLKREEPLLKKESILHQEEELQQKTEELLHKQEEMFAGNQSSGTESSKTLKSSPPRVKFFKVFKYADGYDKVLMVLGLIGAIGDGASVPGMIFIMSGLMDAFGNQNLFTSDYFINKVHKYTLYFTYVAAATFVASFLEAACWIRTGERQASRMRSMYLRALLRQDVGYFDVQGTKTAEVVNSVSADAITIQEAISEKVAHFTMNISTFIGSYFLGFYLTWRLAVVAIAFLPFQVIPGFTYGKIMIGLSQKMHEEYTKAGIVAEQALSSIRTVFSFVGERKTMQKYSSALDKTVKLGLKQGLAKGLAVGSNGVTFGIWAFMAWYGSTLVMYHGVEGGKIIATGISAMLGGLSLGMALPNVKYFSEASIAAHRIFEMIERMPEIDSDDTSGEMLQKVNGELKLKNIDFAYPARPDTKIFKNFCLTIPAGRTLALVGSSGSGKSTVVALLERYYDPQAGEVLIDGVNIKHLQLKWLRSQIGLVSQEPALFATTIRDNILFGKQDATMDEIIAAAKKSNAHNFINHLPDAYDTQVGERGVQMSGGQKQRIAIARAMLKNPPILLLDEATSALDAESERIVQEALDQASLGRTTVVIAHRLSTIRNAEMIAVVKGGEVVEIGLHDELLEKDGGAYATLVHLQQKTSNNEEQNSEEPRTSVVRMSTSSWFSRCSSPRHSTAKSGSLEHVQEHKPPSFRRLLALNSPEWKQATFGCIGAILFGAVQPLYAFALGSMVPAFYIKDHDEVKRQIREYSSIFASIAVGSFLINLIQHYNFTAMGEFLTKRVRQRMLAKILTFEVGWFDEDENNSGAICARLATEANVVRSLVGDRISLLVQTISAVIVACTFGLAISWRLASVMIAVQPLVIICFYTRRVILKTMSKEGSKAQEESSQLAAEAVGNHRTITAFSSQDKILELFEDLQAAPHKDAVRQSWVAGIGLGTAQSIMLCTWALDFWYGGKLVNEGKVTGGQMFKTFFVLVSTGRVIADAGSMTSDIAKGATAVASVFSVLDRVSRIDPEDEEAEKVEQVEGNIELRDVDFAYPARPDIMIFRNFDLKVKAGRSAALVGQSGCGKSTIIGLIERFYDPLKGKVRIDGKDIKKLHLRSLRKHIALVGQEPTLFAGTIRENILYGRESATEAEMIEAAKAANAHDFVSSLKEGYNTNAGDRGVQLSGGQKQRIAIARAILKNPAILLLDEATSALDAQSEKIVQGALDRIMVGRTTIVVAHRLATIQNCDSIAVIQDGCILEQGKHADLLAKGVAGAYYKLVRLQNNTA